jgi:hypothetical protein
MQHPRQRNFAGADIILLRQRLCTLAPRVIFRQVVGIITACLDRAPQFDPATLTLRGTDLLAV